MKIIKGFLVLLSIVFMLCVIVLVGLQIGEWITPQDTKQLQKELQEYKDAEESEELRKAKLESDLDNTAEVIISNFKKVGKLITYEGEVTYKNYLNDENFFGSKKLYVDFVYDFGISYNLSDIDIEIDRTDTVYKTILRVYIPKDTLEVQYVELDNKKSKLDSEKSLLSSQYKPDTIQEINKIAKFKVRDQILNTNQIFTQAHESLKDEILNLVDKLNIDINTIQFDW